MIATMIDSLQSVTSTHAKEDILKDYCILEGVREILKYCYDPYKIYGLGKKSLEPCEGYAIEDRASLHVEEQMFLDALLNGSIGGGRAIDEASRLMCKHGGLLYYIITKDLRCGVRAKSINKICKHLIPTFDVQLAKEVPRSKWKFPMSMECKYDGVRLLAFVSLDSPVTLRTRNGKQVHLPHLISEMSSFPPGVYDGELVIDDGKMVHRSSVSGRVNSAMHGGRVQENDLAFMVFDCLTLSEFANKYSNRYFRDRRQTLGQIFTVHTREYGFSIYVKMSPSTVVLSEAEVDQEYEYFLTQGFEGVVLKSMTGSYEFKRSASWIKLKAIKTADLECIGTEDGKGKYEGAIGALQCRGTVEGKAVTVSVGSGLSDSERDSGDARFVGKVIQIKYNAVIEAFNGGCTLFLPRFDCVRYDKEADV